MVIAFILGLSAYNLWPFLGSGWFYGLIALEFVLLYFIFWLELTGKWKLVAQIFTMACLECLIDELFFDPAEIAINEYIGFGVIIVITFLLYGQSAEKREFRR